MASDIGHRIEQRAPRAPVQAGAPSGVPWGEDLGSDERFRLLADNASDLIYVLRLHPQARYEYVSPSVRRITGYAPEDYYADADLAAKMVHPADRALVDGLFRSPESFAEPVTIRLIRKDERVAWTEHRVTGVRDAEGTLMAVQGIARDVSDRRRAEDELWNTVRTLRNTDAERRRLLSRLVEAEERQRRQLAADLHDDQIQVLAAAALRLDALRHHVSDPTASAHLDELETVLRAAMQRMRHLTFELHPPTLDDHGLVAALRLYVNRLSAEDDVEYVLIDHIREEPNHEGRIILYRIAQEALLNVRKHAQASRVEILVEERDGGYLLRIHDDGVGLWRTEAGPAAIPGHLGMTSMRERAKLAGGFFTARSAAGAGTTIEAWIPDRRPA